MEELRDADPRIVGPFRLVKRLGGGGMGQVFLGRSRGGRLVAVKLVRPEFAGDAGFRRRFDREVRAAREVGGFYTAHVLDADPTGDPPWLATAYIPGPSLEQAVALHGPLPEDALGRLAAGLAEGLTAVHGCGMVHRDLKPGNVLLAADGPRLIDFGIARAAEDTQLTGTGLSIGTPGFMAPEHIIGNRAGPESDVFALGAVLHFAATGRLPFGVGAPHAVNYRVVHEPPDLDGLPAPLVPLVSDCLAKEGTRRPTLAQFLDRVLVPETAQVSWLSPAVTTMIDALEVPTAAPVGTFFGGTDPDTGAAVERGLRKGSSRVRQEDRDGEEERNRRRERAQRLLIRAEEVVSHIVGVRSRTWALAHLAAAAQAVNPARTGFLAVEAHQCAATAPDTLTQIRALAAVSSELAATDNDRARAAAERAEALALAIRGPGQQKARRKALLAAAAALAPVAPDRAEQMVKNTPDTTKRNYKLRDIAIAMAAVDPDRAERIARELSGWMDTTLFGWTLHHIAVAHAATHPDRTERIAGELADRMNWSHTDTLLEAVVDGVALGNPDRAERTAQSIRSKSSRKWALSKLARALTPIDPERALRIAVAIEDTHVDRARAELFQQLVEEDSERAERDARLTLGQEERAAALFELFLRMRHEHPQRAWRAAREIPDGEPWLRVRVLEVIAGDLDAEGASERAEQVLQEAKDIASGISDAEEREHTLAHVAKTLARIDPVQAGNLLDGITYPDTRAYAFLFLALTLRDSNSAAGEEAFHEFVRAAHLINDRTMRQFTLLHGVEEAAKTAPRWATSLALEIADKEHTDRYEVLEGLAVALVDFLPEVAGRLAIEGVHAARRERDGDADGDNARRSLVTLAQVDPAAAARLSMGSRANQPDEALMELVKAMAHEARLHANEWFWGD
ncbi:hypothetical protein DMH12_20865 [Streptomyces sp. WAC 04229]|uniref:serine/threonine-protein kinase n=1 Tax=Streptomyces sp. WAC 04229 TaxID=2203206 RepID=UPI000F7432AA|nr:serine/threonine-protein kinase [Streptomyces sp. WAC 04229]RSN51939.1 hypothetical protein DMH12_20865 [Streptomyces sp. WAC 04229]